MSAPPPLTADQIARISETRFPAILAILLVGCILSTSVVVLRLITRFYIIRTAGADDYMIAVAQVCVPKKGNLSSSKIPSLDYGYRGWCCDRNGSVSPCSSSLLQKD